MNSWQARPIRVRGCVCDPVLNAREDNRYSSSKRFGVVLYGTDGLMKYIDPRWLFYSAQAAFLWADILNVQEPRVQ